MSLSTAALTGTVVAESAHAQELGVETWVFGLIALIIFAILAVVTASYRDVANRHRAKAEAYAARHGDAHGHGH